jgi:hypothetical protein
MGLAAFREAHDAEILTLDYCRWVWCGGGWLLLLLLLGPARPGLAIWSWRGPAKVKRLQLLGADVPPPRCPCCV